MKKTLMIIGGIFISFIVLGIIIFVLVSATSKKMVCKSKEGNITIMYNDNNLTGYTASKISYDFDGQKKYAKQIGIEAYLNEFATWFSNNTTGTCSK